MCMCVLLHDAGRPGSHVPSAIPVTVTSRLEEDSVCNFMPCHVQPQPYSHLISRGCEESVSFKDHAEPSVASVGLKKTQDVKTLKDVMHAKPDNAEPHTEKVDNDTQTGEWVVVF